MVSCSTDDIARYTIARMELAIFYFSVKKHKDIWRNPSVTLHPVCYALDIQMICILALPIIPFVLVCSFS